MPAPPSGYSEPICGALRPPVGHRIVSGARRLRRIKGVTTVAGGMDIGGRPPVEMSYVQELMELALPRFAMPEGLRHVHPPWLVTSEPPAQHQARLSRAGEWTPAVDQTSLSSVYFNLDALTSSSNRESVDVKKCTDLSVTILYKSRR